LLEQKVDNKKSQIKVVLLGETYVFKGESTTAILEAAKYVNEELEAIREQFPQLGRNRVITLALMKTTDALLKAKKDNEDLIEFFSKGE